MTQALQIGFVVVYNAVHCLCNSRRKCALELLRVSVMWNMCHALQCFNACCVCNSCCIYLKLWRWYISEFRHSTGCGWLLCSNILLFLWACLLGYSYGPLYSNSLLFLWAYGPLCSNSLLFLWAYAPIPVGLFLWIHIYELISMGLFLCSYSYELNPMDLVLWPTRIRVFSW